MKRITLTFDNGPDPEVTPRVLDLLRERNIEAHFFVLGKHLATAAGLALARRAQDEGHLVGNHSYTHETPLGSDLRDSAVESEIVATEALLAPLLAERALTNGPKRFRPFGGGGLIGPHLLSQRALDHLVHEQYSCVLWSSVPRDWVDPQGWAARALVECGEREHTVLVLHDVPHACLDGLPRFLDDALAQGFAFVTELPQECVPIVGGRVVADVSGFVQKSTSP